MWPAVLAALLAAPIALGHAAGRQFVDQRCEPVLGLCWSTAYEGSNVALAMKSDDHGGRYQVCVRSPRGKEACRPIRLHRRPPGPHGYGGFRNRVIFAKSFKFGGAGLYRVVWRGYPLEDPISPTLFFKLGSNGKPL
jgi:hypothetical protein